MDQPVARQPDTNEAAPIPASAETKPEGNEGLAQKMAFAKREKALRMQNQQLKAERDAWLKEKAGYAESYIPKSALKERLQRDPLGFLQEHEVSYDALTQQALNPQEVLMQRMQRELEELRAKVSGTETRLQDQSTQSYNQAITQMKNEAKVLVDSDPSFETIKAEGQQEQIVRLIEEVFSKGWEEKGLEKGHILSVEEAAREIEDFLVEDAFRKSNLSKVKARLNPPAEQTPGAKPPQTQPSKTLTNANSTSGKAMSRMERAKAVFYGQQP